MWPKISDCWLRRVEKRVHVYLFVFSLEKITLRDLKRCKLAHIFFDTFFNIEKYLDHEQRDPFMVAKVVTSVHIFFMFGQSIIFFCALTIINTPSRMLRAWDRRFLTGSDMLQRSTIFWWLRKPPTSSTMMGKTSGFHHLFHIVSLSHLSSCIINISAASHLRTCPYPVLGL